MIIKNRFKTYLAALTTACTLLVSHASVATQADIDKEVAKYSKIFKGANFAQQRSAMAPLSYSGLSSPAIFDHIESKLKALKNAESKLDQEEASWFAKTLGLSGNDAYRATLSDIAENAKSKKVRKYAVQGLDRLDNYKKWNPIISANLVNAPAGRLSQARVLNMLDANDYLLMRIGAKRVYYKHNADKALVAKVAKRLESEYTRVEKKNKPQVDAVAWLIKAIAESGDRSYRSLLTKVADGASTKKIKKYAKKYADYLQ